MRGDQDDESALGSGRSTESVDLPKSQDVSTQESVYLGPGGIRITESASGSLWDATNEEIPRDKPVTATQRLPEDQLRRWSLLGIGIVVVLTILLTVVGMAFRWYPEEFARLLLQLVVPPLLSAFAVVVGYLFAERKRS